MVEFFQSLIESQTFQNVITTLSGVSITAIFAVILKLISRFSKYTKNTDTVVALANAALANQKQKEEYDKEIETLKEELKEKMQQTNEMLQLMAINAKNPLVRAKAQALVTQCAKDVVEEIQKAPVAEEKTESEQKLDELDELIAKL